MSSNTNALGYGRAVYARVGAEGSIPLQVATPTDPEHVANKAYVDANLLGGAALYASGGAMTGDLDMGTNQLLNVPDPTLARDAATKAYTDAAVAGTLLRDGTRPMAANLDAGGQRIVNAVDPALATDGATKATVDAVVAGGTLLPASGASATGNIDLGTTNTLVVNSVVKKTTGVSVEAVALTSGTVSANSIKVDGTSTVVTGTSQVNVSDTYVALNSTHTTAVHKPGGVVVNYLPTSTATTVAAGGFSSSSTVVTADGAVFAVGDIVSVTGANNPANNGFFEVDAHSGSTLTIRTSPIEGFAKSAFVADATVAGAIRNITVAVLQVGSSGSWETALGNNVGPTGLVYSSLATTAGMTMSGDLDMGGNRITGLGDPTAAQDAATQAYVQGLSALATTGGTLSGDLDMGGSSTVTGMADPALAQDLATKNYSDNNSRALSTTGGTMVGGIDMGGSNKLINSGTTTLDTDGATVTYTGTAKQTVETGYEGIVARGTPAFATRAYTAVGSAVSGSGPARWWLGGFLNINGTINEPTAGDIDAVNSIASPDLFETTVYTANAGPYVVASGGTMAAGSPTTLSGADFVTCYKLRVGAAYYNRII